MVNRGFEPWSGQTKFYDFCCFSPMYMYAVLRSNSNDWLDRNQNNVSEWWNMSTACCFCKVPLWKNPPMCVGPVQSVHHHFHRHVTCSRHEISHIFLTRRSTTITLPLIRLLFPWVVFLCLCCFAHIDCDCL